MIKRVWILLFLLALTGCGSFTNVEKSQEEYIDEKSSSGENSIINEMQTEEVSLHNSTTNISNEKEESSADNSIKLADVNVIEKNEYKSEEEFFNDILASYSARAIVAAKHTNAEERAMTNKEIAEWRLECVNAEADFEEKYKDALFDDLNIQYLCAQYIKGIEKQKEACETYLQNEDTMDKRLVFKNGFESGYFNRAYVIVELYEYFDVQFPSNAVAEMTKNVNILEKTNEAETRNKAIPKQTVKEVQTLLHLIGFRCWNIDGVAGKKTVKAIKRFQEMYGYEIDGMITDELIEELKTVAEEKGLDWQETINSIN